MVPSALLDLSARASGRVGKNSARGRSPSALFLATRPEASADKSDNARRNHTLIVLPVEINAHARIPCVRFKMAEGSPDAKSSVYLYHYDEIRRSWLPVLDL